jgi:hypothetical protein
MGRTRTLMEKWHAADQGGRAAARSRAVLMSSVLPAPTLAVVVLLSASDRQLLTRPSKHPSRDA